MYKANKILFKYNDEILLEETEKLTSSEIINKQKSLAVENFCDVKEIQIEFFEQGGLDTDVDITPNGDLIFWESSYPKPIIGLGCLITEGSDYYLDRIIDKTIHEFLYFITK